MKRLNWTARLLILICAFLLAGNFSLSFVLIRNSTQALREQIESRMLDVANTAAAMLDGDDLRTLRAEDTDTPEYRTALKTLSRFEESIDLAYIYCVRAQDDGSFIFTIDPDPESPGAFGEHILYTDALYGASLGTPGVDREAYVDQWGRFYSAYSPVFDSQGQVAGIVAVDFTADWFDNQISKQIGTTLIISTTSVLIAALIIFLVVARYRRRFKRLLQEMNVVSKGIETLVQEVTPGAHSVAWQEETVHGGDEMEQLGNRIDLLQEKLSERIALVRSQTYVDGLTGLGNRAAYEEHVHRIQEKMHEGSASFVIAIFDLNSLKEINDRYGHNKGDDVIRAAAAKLCSVFHDGKQYRIGGDEFVVILEGCFEDPLPRLEIMRTEQDGFSISGGLAVYDRENDPDYRMVFNRADKEMYNDKRNYYLTHGDRRKR